MMCRSLALAAFASPLLACLPMGENTTGNASNTTPSNQTATLLPGKWGTLLSDGTPDTSSGYFFAADGTWGHFEAGTCTAGDSFVVQGDILTLRAGSTQLAYQVDFAGSNTQIRFRTPGTLVGDAASSAPTYVFGLLDHAGHTCAAL